MLFLDNNEKPAKCIKIPIIREKWSKEIFSDSRNCHVFSSSFTQQMGTENRIYQRISEFQIVTGLKDDTYRRNYDFQVLTNLTPQSRKDSFKMCRGTELVSTDVESISKADKTCLQIEYSMRLTPHSRVWRIDFTPNPRIPPWKKKKWIRFWIEGMKNFGTTLWKELRFQLPNPVASLIIIHESPLICHDAWRLHNLNLYNVYNTTIVVVAVHFCAILGNLYYSVAEQKHYTSEPS